MWWVHHGIRALEIDVNRFTETSPQSIFESLPISAEQAQCLIDEIGIEQLTGIADGTSSPLAILPALGTCNISITDLIAA